MYHATLGPNPMMALVNIMHLGALESGVSGQKEKNGRRFANFLKFQYVNA